MGSCNYRLKGTILTLLSVVFLYQLFTTLFAGSHTRREQVTIDLVKTAASSKGALLKTEDSFKEETVVQAQTVAQQLQYPVPQGEQYPPEPFEEELQPVNQTATTSNGVTSVISPKVSTETRENPSRIPLKHVYRISEVVNMSGVPQNKLLSRCKNTTLTFKERFCTSYEELSFMSDSKETVALASFPGSGNTWTRLLLEELTGYYTGSVYNDPTLLCTGMLGEVKDGTSVVAVKTHVFQKKWNKVIYLFRNPFHSIFSYYTWDTFRDHTTSFKTDDIRVPTLKFNRYFWLWQQIWNHYIFSNNFKLLLLDYQLLQTNLEAELRKMVEFLGLEVNENRLKCLVNHQKATTAYKRSAAYKFPYDKSQKTKIQTWINTNQAKLKTLGINVTSWVW